MAKLIDCTIASNTVLLEEPEDKVSNQEANGSENISETSEVESSGEEEFEEKEAVEIVQISDLVTKKAENPKPGYQYEYNGVVIYDDNARIIGYKLDVIILEQKPKTCKLV